MDKYCKRCVYNRTLAGSEGGERACHYMLITDKPRGCKGGEGCARFAFRTERTEAEIDKIYRSRFCHKTGGEDR